MVMKSLEYLNLLARERYGYQDLQSETDERLRGCLAYYRGSKGLRVLYPARQTSSENGK